MFLQITVTDIQPYRVTENTIGGRFRTDIFRRSADDDRKLDLKIGSMLGKRDFNRAAMRQQRAWRLEPDQRSAQRSPFHLRNVIGVIESDGDQFRGRNWKIDTNFCERQNLACWLDVSPIRPRQHVHVFAARFAIEKPVARPEPAKCAHVHDITSRGD